MSVKSGDSRYDQRVHILNCQMESDNSQINARRMDCEIQRAIVVLLATPRRRRRRRRGDRFRGLTISTNLMTDAARLASSTPHEATRVRVDTPAQEPSSAT